MSQDCESSSIVSRDHHLCEEPDCEEKKFVVFRCVKILMSDALIVYFEQSIPETGISHFLSRTEIDLKGHRLAQHSGALSKVS